MSRYYSIDGGEPSFLASTSGWGAFCDWTRTLDADDEADLLHLVDYGWDENLAAISRQLRRALNIEPPAADTEDVAQTLLALLEQLSDSSVLTITDGLSPDSEGGDGGKVAQKSWDESRHPRNHGKFSSKPGSSGATLDRGESNPQKGRLILRRAGKSGIHVFEQIGHSAAHLERVVSEYISSGIGERVARLSPKMQSLIKGVWHAIRLGSKALFATFTAGQALAERVARERGATPEQAAKLRAVLSTIDIASFKPVSAGVAAAAGASLAAALSFVPLGSMTYLAYSMATDPLAIMRAARRLVAGAMNRGHAVKAMGGQEQTVLLAESLYDALAAHDFADDYFAVLLAALDATGNVGEAIRVAGEASSSNGESWQEQQQKVLVAWGNKGRWEQSGEYVDLGDAQERAELMADILGGLFGEQALEIFSEAKLAEDSRWQKWRSGKTWNELDHPRGKNGRFIKKGSAEAVGAATTAIGRVLRHGSRNATPEQRKSLAEHLNILTVKQLRSLAKEHGLKVPKLLREELVGAILGESEISEHEGNGKPTAGNSEQVAEEVGRPRVEATAGARSDAAKPVSPEAPRRLPAQVERVNGRLDRYEQHFRARGNHQLADWMGMLRNHIQEVGVETALDALGPEAHGQGEEVQYGGANLETNEGNRKHDADFIEQYLDRAGISLIHGNKPKGKNRAISSVVGSSDKEGLHERGNERDFFPKLQTLRDKLHESQHLPGLEKSEDLGKLMGGSLGSEVTHLTPEVLQKLDDTYGKDQWVVKCYDDAAYAGFGIFFPQRARQIQQDARNVIWDSGSRLAKYGFGHLRDDKGKIVGIKHENGDEYYFETEKYDETINGDVRHWADKAREASDDEQATALPRRWADTPTRYMAQPAFPVVGISNEERAQGITFKRGQEGRTHIITRDGKAELVPHSTWLKLELMPVVFEDDDTRAMAQAAVDAINALPESERQGQIYAPDIIRTANGYKVVEANPSNEAGGSGYLGDNPFIIDSYVSRLTGREPAHVRFIRKLLTENQRGERQQANAAGANRQGGRKGREKWSEGVPKHDAPGTTNPDELPSGQAAKRSAAIAGGLKKKRAAQETLLHAQQNISRHGFDLLYNDAGKVAGIEHENGDQYLFGTGKYDRTIHGDVRHWADQARRAAGAAHARIAGADPALGDSARLERQRRTPEELARVLRQAGVGELPSTETTAKQEHHRQLLERSKRAGHYIAPEKIPVLAGDVENVGGHEHDVYLDPNNPRVWKLTANGKLGHGDKGVHDYLRRLQEANRLWPSLAHYVHGVTEDHAGRPQIITSMNHVAGHHPPQAEINDWFRSRGWQPVSWDGEHGDENIRSWQDPKTGTVISDTHSGNFIKTADGLVPIDVDIVPGKKKKQVA